jgi:Arc/MetJ-type ribon-helix-helix transcriptional regulator
MATKAPDQQLTAKIVTLRLNRQQLELIDRTVARGVAPDRASLIRLALKEYAGSRNRLKHRT